MSTFEIILVVIIYMFGYGYTLANIADDNIKQNKTPSTLLTVLRFILCFVWAFFFPLLLSFDIYIKLNSK